MPFEPLYTAITTHPDRSIVMHFPIWPQIVWLYMKLLNCHWHQENLRHRAPNLAKRQRCPLTLWHCMFVLAQNWFKWSRRRACASFILYYAGPTFDGYGQWVSCIKQFNTLVADGEGLTPYVNPQRMSMENRYRQGSTSIIYIYIWYVGVLAAFAWTCCIAACHFIKRIGPHLFVPKNLAVKTCWVSTSRELGLHTWTTFFSFCIFLAKVCSLFDPPFQKVRYYLKWASSESPEDDKKNDQAAQSAISLHKSLGKFFQFLGFLPQCQRLRPDISDQTIWTPWLLVIYLYIYICVCGVIYTTHLYGYSHKYSQSLYSFLLFFFYAGLQSHIFMTQTYCNELEHSIKVQVASENPLRPPFAPTVGTAFPGVPPVGKCHPPSNHGF